MKPGQKILRLLVLVFSSEMAKLAMIGFPSALEEGKMIFSGRMSLWIIPREWMWARADKSFWQTSAICFSLKLKLWASLPRKLPNL